MPFPVLSIFAELYTAFIQLYTADLYSQSLGVQHIAIVELESHTETSLTPIHIVRIVLNPLPC